MTKNLTKDTLKIHISLSFTVRPLLRVYFVSWPNYSMYQNLELIEKICALLNSIEKFGQETKQIP